MAAQAKRKSTKTSAEPPLRILCFGNSLTCGYPVGNPYADKVAEKIEAAFPGRKVECEVEGMPGDLVTTGLFLNRMQMSCKRPTRFLFIYPVAWPCVYALRLFHWQSRFVIPYGGRTDALVYLLLISLAPEINILLLRD